MTQSSALAILKTGANVFLTGKPGSGKTHTVNLYRDYLREHGIETAVTASTGIAATHLGGQTIHSWSGIGIRKDLTSYDFNLMREKKYLLPRLQSTKVLIIDEISMLDAQTLDQVDQTLQALRESDRPFGGLQIVFVGDFFQLPPVEKLSKFAFESSAWQEAQPVICYLSEQHRQEDTHFLSVLDSIRTGENISQVENALSMRIIESDIETTVTRLYSHNVDVDRVNTEWLEQLSGEESVFQMKSKGQKNQIASLIKGCLSPETLILKKGARVMFTKNNIDEGFVNGTIGEVVSFTKENFPLVRTTEGSMIEVQPMEWVIEENEKKIASISQLPLRLAWAITVHKSQGMTIDSALIDLSRTFEYGQGYVAISRVRTLSGLYLIGFNEMALKVHPKIQEVDTEFKTKSQNAEKRLSQYSDNDIATKHKNFIIASDGSLKKIEVKKQKPKTEYDGSTYEATLVLFKQGKVLTEIAKTRDLTLGTILGHIEKLHQNAQIEKKELKPHVPDYLRKDLTKIHKVFKKLGSEKLSPVFESFKGKYSYEELKLARIMM